ncbi:hypothetical protein D3C73_828070 [compost metagenome]
MGIRSSQHHRRILIFWRIKYAIQQANIVPVIQGYIAVKLDAMEIALRVTLIFIDKRSNLCRFCHPFRKFDGDRFKSAISNMSVAVDQPRHQVITLQINANSIRTGLLQHIVERSHGNDFFAFNSDGLWRGIIWIGAVDFPAKDNHFITFQSRDRGRRDGQ